jgi:serine/threonine protein kinase
MKDGYTPERRQQIKQVLAAALTLNPEDRGAFVAEACANDDALLREVEALLSADGHADEFLETPARIPTTLQTGMRLGPYEILSPIGAGGMGEVYRGRDTRLQRTVAIKVLSPDVVHDSERRRRFLQEARAASALSHPNIVTLHDIGSEGGVDFFVMEYVPETSLDRLISTKPLPLAEVLECGIQIAKALVSAHSAGIVHRDIKPANIMVTPQGQVKVLDFGLAKWPDQGVIDPDGETKVTYTSMTQAGQVMGTIAYMSPEQARGERLDARTDLFSLGAVLYEMATGHPAFPKAFDWTPPPAAGIPAPLHRIILKLLQPDRELRYRTATEVVSDLRHLQSKQSHRHRLMLVAVAGVLAALLVSAAIWFRQVPPSAQAQWVQVTNMPDPVGQPALSPDGRMLAFVRGSGTFYTEGQIYIKMLPNGEPKPLTHDAVRKLAPVFSPDGARIAYTTLDESGFKWDTWTVPVLGGEPGLWLPNASGLTWIGNRQVMFSEMKTAPHMAIVSAEESRANAKDVYVPARENGMAHRSFMSPDGKWALVAEMDGSWLPCRLVSLDGKQSSRRVGPADASCTNAAWSPDGKWMYLNSSAGGGFHIWRQRFPDGQPEQITSGQTQEEGIAMAADGRSLVTAVGLRQATIMVHDSHGERQISLEGFAIRPSITSDGKRVCYAIMKGASATSDPTELWVTDLDSGSSDQVLPGFSLAGVSGFDVSPDGHQIAAVVRNRDGKGELWLIALDKQTSPRQIPNIEVDRMVKWLQDEIVFYAKEGNSGYAYRIRQDGTGLRKAIEQPISEIQGVSPDGQWLVAWTGEIIAYPISKGSPIRIFGSDLKLRWSRDTKFLFVGFSETGAGGLASASGKTYVVPLSPGQMFPPIPAGGFRSQDEIEKLPGVRVINASDATPGPTPDTYAYSRETTQRNLYRIPLR